MFGVRQAAARKGSMSHLKSKVAAVTGAAKSIGAVVAKELANHGAAVIVNYASSRQPAEGW